MHAAQKKEWTCDSRIDAKTEAEEEEEYTIQ